MYQGPEAGAHSGGPRTAKGANGRDRGVLLREGIRSLEGLDAKGFGMMVEFHSE